MRTARLAFAVLIAWLISVPALVAAPGSSRLVRAIGMTVSDVDRSVAFYTQVLTFEKISDVEVAGGDYEHLEGLFGVRMRVVSLKLGSEQLVLTQYLVPKGRAFPTDSRSNDRWFQHAAIVVSDMDRAYTRLRESHVEYASSGPQTLPAWNKAAGGIRAFYFRDPDEHYLELIEFPAGKGDPRWQRSDGRLFLGIDHSAIVVGDTARSEAFYRGLGFHITGGSENYGDEQEHLNNVFGAHLRITSMRTDGGPGIELLEYRVPRDGRAMPADIHPNDVVFWDVMIAVPDRSLLERLGANLVATPRRELGFEDAAIVRDPDGHAMELVEE
jgi:catechol 2,3-dioxygenase-like lactoylglutathione lyase family enzyme